jgi:hypothetical protein
LQNKILHGKTLKHSINGRHGKGGASSSSAVDASKFETMVATTLDSKLKQFKKDLLASLRSGGGQSSGGGWESSHTKQAQGELAQLSSSPDSPTIPPPAQIGPTHMTYISPLLCPWRGSYGCLSEQTAMAMVLSTSAS